MGSKSLKLSLQNRKNGCRHGDSTRYKVCNDIKIFVKELKDSGTGVILPSSGSISKRKSELTKRAKQEAKNKKIEAMKRAKSGGSRKLSKK